MFGQAQEATLTPAPDLERYTLPTSIWVALRTGHVRLLRASWRESHCAGIQPRLSGPLILLLD
eukprot:628617-Prymnesium_polylepis.1